MGGPDHSGDGVKGACENISLKVDGWKDSLVALTDSLVLVIYGTLSKRTLGLQRFTI